MYVIIITQFSYEVFDMKVTNEIKVLLSASDGIVNSGITGCHMGG